jgi:hypothetical protein
MALFNAFYMSDVRNRPSVEQYVIDRPVGRILDLTHGDHR